MCNNCNNLRNGSKLRLREETIALHAEPRIAIVILTSKYLEIQEPKRTSYS